MSRPAAVAAVTGPRSGSPWRRLPAGLAVAAVLCQVAYPLLGGESRDRLTVVTVVVFAAASLSHVAVSRGARATMEVAAVLAGGGLAVEALGVATGFPFGTYAYSPRLGPMVAEVPVVIPLAWTMLGWPSLVVALRTTAGGWARVAVGTVALASWDLFLDPQMVAEGYWSWAGDGPHLIDTIPVTNYLAWLGVAAAMMAALVPLSSRWEPTATNDDLVPVGLYVWTWAGSTLAHLAFLGLPRSGVYGGVAMGLVVTALLRRTAPPPRSAPTGGAPAIPDRRHAAGPRR